MTEYMGNEERGKPDRFGRIVGGIAFVASGAEIFWAGTELVSRQIFDGTCIGALGVATAGLGWAFWAKSAKGALAEPLENESQPPGYLYMWVEEVGWVPLQPYDSDGPQNCN